MPADSGLAFVVVTHQASDRVSLLRELLEKRTTMPVHEATVAVKVEPNHIYLSPPGMYLALLNSVLQPMPADPIHGGLQFPIDYFFRSLADDQKDRAICIVLSGTGTDGTLGLQAVKGAGGLTLVQEEQSAKFAGMPHSAITTGLVDSVLPIRQMPHVLITFARGPYLQSAVGPASMATLTPDLLRRIYILLRSHTRHDFSVYKPNTLRRRIERRMHVHQVQDAEQYLRFLHEHPYEIDLLFQELLIGVTSFFRDPEAFAFLATTAFPDLVATRSQNHPLRVWVPGCSTGEEAYTLAIVLRECLERSQKSCPIQIFATDLHNQAVEKARTGLYPEGIAADVSCERLERYFVREDGSYRIKPAIRECVVFTRQNLLADPPFTKLDLLSCRNLLIYLNAEVQHQLIPLFHYVLNPGGLLCLGSSETIGSFTDLFIPLDHRWKVFRRKESAVAAPLPVAFPVQFAKPTTEEPTARGLTKPSDATLAGLVEKLLVQQFAPPSVIVSDSGEIVYIHGLTGLFLQPAPGLPSHNLFTMAREGLRMELIAAVRHVAAHEGAVVQKQVQFRSNGGVSPVRVTVQRLTDPEPVRGLFLVTFQTLENKPSRPRKRRKGHVSAGDHERVEALERELQVLRETLQSTIEEANTANEELKSTNEELQSTNEELQSANEELETAKEEMQSLNEELQTVNSELQRKVEDLSHANNDMQNLLNSTDIATLFLDSDLCIKRFTPQAKRIFKIIPSDVGRPIGDLVSTVRYGRLQADAQEVLQTLVFKELEISTDDGKWYAMRIMPYRTSENVIDGVVITFSDITTQKQTERANHAAQRYAESIVETVREALVVLDEELRVISANRAFYRMFQLSPQGATNRRLYELNDGQWNLPRLNHLLEDILVRHSVFEDFAVEFTFAAGEQKALVLNARRIEQATDLPPLILLAIEDVTKRKPGA